MQQAASDVHHGVWHTMTDRQLIETYAWGKGSFHDAFGVFVNRHESALLSFAASFLRDESLAQDVVQEVFLRAARNPQRILKCGNGEGGGERNWLLKVVRDVSVDSLRRRASERRVVEKAALLPSINAPAADAAMEGREQSERVRVAIDRLKPRLRELLILKVQEQKSYKEIAQIAGLTVTNVGFLLHQAMQALAQELKD